MTTNPSHAGRQAEALEGIAAAIAEAGRAYQSSVTEALAALGAAYPQIDGSVPAQEAQGESGGSGTSGGLGGRLRALGTGQTRSLRKDLREIADEADELAAAYRVADAEIARLTEFHDHYRAQVDAIRAAIKREAGHGDAITRCSLVAERFQTVLDGATNENEGGA